jgi:hypothetical protein
MSDRYNVQAFLEDLGEPRKDFILKSLDILETTFVDNVRNMCEILTISALRMDSGIFRNVFDTYIGIYRNVLTFKVFEKFLNNVLWASIVCSCNETKHDEDFDSYRDIFDMNVLDNMDDCFYALQDYQGHIKNCKHENADDPTEIHLNPESDRIEAFNVHDISERTKNEYSTMVGRPRCQ